MSFANDVLVLLFLNHGNNMIHVPETIIIIVSVTS